MSKRMFSTTIVESDAFLDMPLTAQALYMHLNMNADNDGFVQPRRVLKMTGAANDDLQILIAKRFLLSFNSGVVVIKHWWLNNTKRADRHVPTAYQKELSELYLKENKSYTKDTTQLALVTDRDLNELPPRQPNGNHWLPQYNAVQDNSIQSKAVQTNADKPRDFKKNYAKAAQADREHEARIAGNAERTKQPGYEAFTSVGEMLKKRNKA